MEPTEANLIAKKLLIKTAQRWLFSNAPAGFVESFASLAIHIKTSIAVEGDLDGVLLFVKNSAQLQAALPAIIPVLALLI